MMAMVRFTDHAQYRLLERGISIEQIKVVLKSPQLKRFSHGRWVARAQVDDENVEVVYVEKGRDMIVLTAYYV